MNQLQALLHKEQRVLTTQQLADVYETSVDNIKMNYNRNKTRFIEGKHYHLLKGDELREFKNKVTDSYSVAENEVNLVGKNANQLILWTEKGADRHCKILDTDKAWEQFDNLEETYFKVKDASLAVQNLSPELRLLISMELKQKEQDKEITFIKERVESIRDVVAIDTTSWRDETGKLLRRIGNECGDNASYQEVRAESYHLLEKRMGVNLSQRLTNKRRRMADEGICKSKRDRVNNLDIIEEDKKLIEGYIAIMKELAIHYGIA